MIKSNRTKKASVKQIKEIENGMTETYNRFDFRFKKREFKFTDKQKVLLSLLDDKDTKIVFVEGPAGTSKSMLGVYSGLKQMKEGRIDTIMYLRSVVESAQKSMGFLPGDAEQKLSFFTNIIDDKLSELVEAQDIPGFHAKKKIETMPLNYIRGCSWRKTFILADEIQNYNKQEILSTLTRIGEGSVMVLCGDRSQSDIKNSGFSEVFDLFDDDESKERGIHTFKFNEDDIVRSEIVKYIVKKFNHIER
jgi:phosphate starvation-inducible protein PhoH and related proteins